MDPNLRKAVRKRAEWIRRHPGGSKEGFPGGAMDYIRLSRKDQARVDALFLAERKLKPNEVSSLVERLTEERLIRNRVGNLRKLALANMLAKLDSRPKLRDDTVIANVERMSQRDLKIAASASTDELIGLARVQEDMNPFWYH